MIDVKLWDHVGAGLIFKVASGVRYSNQVAGHGCEHPTCEGVFLPLGNDVDGHGRLLGLQPELEVLFDGSWHALSSERASQLDALFERWAPGWNGLRLRVDRDQLARSREAWVHVTVARDGPAQLVQGIPSRARAVLTWCNSD